MIKLYTKLRKGRINLQAWGDEGPAANHLQFLTTCHNL